MPYSSAHFCSVSILTQVASKSFSQRGQKRNSKDDTFFRRTQKLFLNYLVYTLLSTTGASLLRWTYASLSTPD